MAALLTSSQRPLGCRFHWRPTAKEEAEARLPGGWASAGSSWLAIRPSLESIIIPKAGAALVSLVSQADPEPVEGGVAASVSSSPQHHHWAVSRLLQRVRTEWNWPGEVGTGCESHGSGNPCLHDTALQLRKVPRPISKNLQGHVPWDLVVEGLSWSWKVAVCPESLGPEDS